ncbi:Hypothetical predicted protein [Lecanosticta acicola]|uniref:Uncharacterized protein n=1 Tax=Lecanosticta acicola TaxID=111012 RepID=A0AAI9EEA1_9PEZI|nr:Hypothetical predicted protein [Lecanosticta acicola]
MASQLSAVSKKPAKKQSDFESKKDYRDYLESSLEENGERSRLLFEMEQALEEFEAGTGHGTNEDSDATKISKDLLRAISYLCRPEPNFEKVVDRVQRALELAKDCRDAARS